MIADSVHGIWNATEAIPLTLQASLTTSAIPKLDENPLWLPVDVVASTIADIFLIRDCGRHYECCKSQKLPLNSRSPIGTSSSGIGIY